MIIVMAADEKQMEHARIISTLGNTNKGLPISVQSVNLFDQVDFSKVDDERLTFLGHGSQKTFGSIDNVDEISSGLTSQDFVKSLLRKGFSNKVKTIDLFGCNIGLADENSVSFVNEVAEIFSKTPNCSHIVVNAITSDQFESVLQSQKLSRLILSTQRQNQSTEDAKTDKITVHVSGVSQENGEQYKNFLIKEKSLNEHLENLRFQWALLKRMDLTKLNEDIKEKTLVRIKTYEEEITSKETDLTQTKSQKHE